MEQVPKAKAGERGEAGAGVTPKVRYRDYRIEAAREPAGAKDRERAGARGKARVTD